MLQRRQIVIKAVDNQIDKDLVGTEYVIISFHSVVFILTNITSYYYLIIFTITNLAC